MSLFSKFFSQKPTKDERCRAPDFTLLSKAKANPNAFPSVKSDGAYRTGTLIANRYEVVQGPREKPSLAGGMGLVYLCVDHEETGRPVALKTFRPELLPDRAARDRFLREGTTWVELGKHPHLVRCHEVIKGAVGSEVFFVLDLVAPVEGKRDASLRSWLTPGKPLSVEQALLFALHIARGMKYATTKIPTLVHRDLKPENVLVGRDGIARVTDFGLAKAVQATEGKLLIGKDSEETNFRRTQLTMGIVGTPLYMAPEQWAGVELDVRTDIYAFGCILYEMIAGKSMVMGSNLHELEQAHRAVNVSRAELPKNSPDEVRALLCRCVVPSRDERYLYWAEMEVAVANAYYAIADKDAPNEINTESETRAERMAAGLSYNAIGLSYAEIGKNDLAMRHFEKLLAIANEFGDLSAKAMALGNLGNINDTQGVFGLAIDLYSQQLTISRTIGYLYGEANALVGLGNVYRRTGETRRAIEYYEQNVEIWRKIGDRNGEAMVLTNLGGIYTEIGNPAKGIMFYEQALPIMREIGNRRGEGNVLANLGSAYNDLGDSARAIEFSTKSLAITQAIGDRLWEGIVLGNLGKAYRQLGDKIRAIRFYEQALTIMQEIGDRYGEGKALDSLGITYGELGDTTQAIELFNKRIVLAREIGDVLGVAFSSFNLALMLFRKGRQVDALRHAESAAQAFAYVGHNPMYQRTQQLIAQIRMRMQ